MIKPGESKILPTGLKFGVPHGYMIQIMNRSGNAAKKQLMVGACVVDSGYDGEVFVNLHNIGKEAQTVSAGDKIATMGASGTFRTQLHFEIRKDGQPVDPLTVLPNRS